MVKRLVAGLDRYLEGKGYASLADLRGNALPNLVQFPQLDLSYKLLAAVVPEKCNGCGLCVTACDSGGYQAIKLVEGTAVADEFLCDGCGLCVGICPTRGIVMVPVPE